MRPAVLLLLLDTGFEVWKIYFGLCTYIPLFPQAKPAPRNAPNAKPASAAAAPNPAASKPAERKAVVAPAPAPKMPPVANAPAEPLSLAARLAGSVTCLHRMPYSVTVEKESVSFLVSVHGDRRRIQTEPASTSLSWNQGRDAHHGHCAYSTLFAFCLQAGFKNWACRAHPMQKLLPQPPRPRTPP